MAGVVPAWKLKDILDLKRFRDQRSEDERTETAKLATDPTVGVTDTAVVPEPPTTEDNPSHEADFNRLLDAAVRTPKSSGRT